MSATAIINKLRATIIMRAGRGAEIGGSKEIDEIARQIFGDFS